MAPALLCSKLFLSVCAVANTYLDTNKSWFLSARLGFSFEKTYRKLKFCKTEFWFCLVGLAHKRSAHDGPNKDLELPRDDPT